MRSSYIVRYPSRSPAFQLACAAASTSRGVVITPLRTTRSRGSHRRALPLDLAGARERGLRDELALDQVQREVDARGHARGGDDVAVVDHALALAHVGAESPEILDRGVMGDRRAPAQDPGLG